MLTVETVWLEWWASVVICSLAMVSCGADEIVCGELSTIEPSDILLCIEVPTLSVLAVSVSDVAFEVSVVPIFSVVPLSVFPSSVSVVPSSVVNSESREVVWTSEVVFPFSEVCLVLSCAKNSEVAAELVLVFDLVDERSPRVNPLVVSSPEIVFISVTSVVSFDVGDDSVFSLVDLLLIVSDDVDSNCVISTVEGIIVV